MICKCENHQEEFTCSGTGCQVCVLDEENYIENPQSKKERYCFNCAMKKGGFTEQELWQLMMANPDTSLGCHNKSDK